MAERTTGFGFRLEDLPPQTQRAVREAEASLAKVFGSGGLADQPVRVDAARFTDEDFNTIYERELAKQLAARPKPSLTEETAQGLARVGPRYRHSTGTLERMFGHATGDPARAAAGRQRARIAEYELSKLPLAVPRLEKVRSARDFLAFLAGQGPEQAANLGAAAAAGMAGAKAGGVLGPKGAAAGLFAGTFTASLLLNSAETFDRLLKDGANPQEALIATGLAGVPQALLDTIVPGRIAGKILRVRGTRLAGRAQRGLARRMASEAAKAFAGEAVTEASQEAIGNLANTIVNEVPFLTPETAWDLANAAVLGGVMGGGVGTLAGIPADQPAATPERARQAEQAVKQAVSEHYARAAEATPADQPVRAGEPEPGRPIPPAPAEPAPETPVAAPEAPELAPEMAVTFDLGDGPERGTVREVYELEDEAGAPTVGVRIETPDGGIVDGEADQLNIQPFKGEGTRQAPVQEPESPDEMAPAAAQVAEPTEAQKEAGNYKKGHLRLHGLDITIENPRGSERSGTGPDGKPWSVKMLDDYGYVKRTEGADGDQVDVYVGKNPQSTHVTVIDQADPDTGVFDEHKVMLGFRDRADAIRSYATAFDDGRGMKRIGAATNMTVDQFKDWLKTGDTTKPLGMMEEETARGDEPIEPPEAVAAGPEPAPEPAPVEEAEAGAQAAEAEVAPQVAPTQPDLLGGPEVSEQEMAAREAARARIREMRDQGMDYQEIRDQLLWELGYRPEPSDDESAPEAAVAIALDRSIDSFEPHQRPAVRMLRELERRPGRPRLREETAATAAEPVEEARAEPAPAGPETAEATTGGPEGPGSPPSEAEVYKQVKDGLRPYVRRGDQHKGFNLGFSTDNRATVFINMADARRGRIVATLGHRDETGAKIRYEWSLAKTWREIQRESSGPGPEPDVAPETPKEVASESEVSDEPATAPGREPEAAPAGRLRGAEAPGPARKTPDRLGREPAREPGEPGDGTGEGGRPARRHDESGAQAQPDQERERGTAGPRAGRREPRREPAGAGREAAGLTANYRITDADKLGQGSARTKAAQNIEAIRILRRLEQDKRPATAEEKAKLVKYVGWGASELRNNMFPDPNTGAFREGWQSLGQELRDLLADADYELAKRSTQYAHYTSKEVIDGIWQALERLGFQGGRVLEPGAGIGHFAGLIPAEVSDSTYVGIEMDPTSAGIAAVLYPGYTMRQEDFTRTKLPEDFFDLAIGNPPFADITVRTDPKYAKHRFSLHDYFMAKSVDAVRPGGLVAMISSHYTLDKAKSAARDYIADRADMIAAIRLPQTAFLENAGTEVVTDIMIFRRRAEGAKPGRVRWQELKEVKTKDGPAWINEYFTDHPEMVLGTHALTGSMYGKAEYTVEPADEPIKALLRRAVMQIDPQDPVPVETTSPTDQAAADEKDFSPKADKDGGYYIGEDGRLMQREHGIGAEAEVKKAGRGPGLYAKQVQIIRSYIPVRDAGREVLRSQLEGGDAAAAQKRLNKAYDAFVKKHGAINKVIVGSRRNAKGQDVETRRYPNIQAFREDPDAYLIASFEHFDEASGEATKAPIFDREVVAPWSEPQIGSAKDALNVVLNRSGRVDLELIAELAGMTEEAAELELGTAIYRNPATGKWETDDDYLSGDIRQKLRAAEAAGASRNIEALKDVMPADLNPSEIHVRLGAPWVPVEVVEAFAEEEIGLGATVSHMPSIGAWSVATNYGARYSAAGMSEWGTPDRGAIELLADALNARRPRITRTVKNADGTTTTILDEQATEAALEKLDKIKERFSRWIWQDPERADNLARTYNDNYNTVVPRKFDGGHLEMPGQSSARELRPHQKQVVWRIVQQGNTYMAHAVGAGKTMAMAAAGVEMKRLGIVKKPMYVVPNHMLKQFSTEFLELYPTAELMVADETQFHTSRRKRFLGRIAASTPDAVVITHSAFGFVRPSADFEADLVQREIDAVMEAIEIAKQQAGDRTTRRRLEKTKERLQQRLDSLANRKGDEHLSFEELGIDFLFVDEAQEFRKLQFHTSQSNMKGIQPEGSNRAWDLYVKTRYLESVNPGRSLVLASGTPITNTLGEMYTIQRFLQEPVLARLGIEHFDAWASMFGETATNIEMTAAGGYKQVTRFAKFSNLPELIRQFRDVADVVTSEQLTFVQRPAVRTGKRQIVTADRSVRQKDFQTVLGQRLDAIAKRTGPPQKGDDIVPVVQQDGIHAAIDMRLVIPSAPNEPGNKLNTLIARAFEIWQATAENVYEDARTDKPEPLKGATQMIFADIGTPSAEAKRGFSAYHWIRDELVRLGVPRDQIAFMQQYKKSEQKLRLFADMNAGRKRILIGSTPTMGTGVNAQQRLIALHHLDARYLPSDIAQREGRIVRQGNKNEEVDVLAYATKGTFDATMWQIMETKQRFIDQALSGDTSIREMDDVGSIANEFAVAKAIASGDPRLIEMAGLQGDVERLARLERAHQDDQLRVRREIKRAAAEITHLEEAVPAYRRDAEKVEDLRGDAFTMKVGRRTVTERGEAGDLLVDQAARLDVEAEPGRHKVGEISGFEIVAVVDQRDKDGDTRSPTDLALVRATAELRFLGLGRDPAAGGIAKRLENAVEELAHAATQAEQGLTEWRERLRQFEARQGAPFDRADDLAEARGRFEDLEASIKAEAEAEKREGLPKSDDGEQAVAIEDDEISAPMVDTSTPPATPQENIARGAQAMELVLEHEGNFRRAMYRADLVTEDDPDTGWIAFIWGKGGGIKHLMDRREANQRIYGEDFARQIPEIIAKGRLGRYYLTRDTGRIGRNIIYGGNTVALGLEYFGERRNWVVTAFPGVQEKTGEADFVSEKEALEVVSGAATRRDTAPSVAATQPEPSLSVQVGGDKKNIGVEGAEGKAPRIAEFGDDDAANLQRLRAVLAEELGRFGLDDRVGLKVHEELFSGDLEIAGRFVVRRGRHLIEATLSEDPIGTIRHEAIHALRALGVISAEEWAVLRKRARRQWRAQYGIDRYYGEVWADSPEMLDEEAVAEAFRHYGRGHYRPKSTIRAIFDRIGRFIWNLGRRFGLLSRDRAAEIFDRIERGELGQRPTDPAMAAAWVRAVRGADEAEALAVIRADKRKIVERFTGARADPGVAVKRPKTSGDVPFWKQYFHTPEAVFRKHSAPLYKVWRRVSRLMDRQSKWNRELRETTTQVLKPVMKAGRDRLDDVNALLHLGDQLGRSFSRGELLRGYIEAEGERTWLLGEGAKPTREVVEGYLGMRRLVSKMGRMIDNHERKMRPTLRKRKMVLVRKLARLTNRERAEFGQLYERLVQLRSRYRRAGYATETSEDPTTLAAQIAADERVLLGAFIDDEGRIEDGEFLEAYEELMQVEAKLQRTSMQKRKGYWPHKFFGNYAVYQTEDLPLEQVPEEYWSADHIPGAQLPSPLRDRMGIAEDENVSMFIDEEEAVARISKLIADPRHGFYQTVDDAIRAANAYKRQAGEATVKVMPIEFQWPNAQATELSDAAYFRYMGKVAEQLGITVDEAMGESRDVARRRYRRRIAGFSHFRKGIAGYSREFERVWDAHIGQVIRYITMDEAKYVTINAIEREGLSTRRSTVQERPILSKMVNDWFRDVNGQKQIAESQVDELFDKPWATPLNSGLAFGTAAALAGGFATNPLIGGLIGSYVGYRFYKGVRDGGNFKSRAVTGAMLEDMAHLKLGSFFNVFSALVNLSQTMLNTYPVLGAKWTAEGTRRYMAAVTRGRDAASKPADKLTQADRDFLLLQRVNVNTAFKHSEVSPHLFEREAAWKRASLWLFNHAEGVNRGTAFLGAYGRAEARGASPAQAKAAGNEAMRRTQFDYSNVNKPALLRNVFLRVPAQFKNFVAQEIAFVAGLRGKEAARFMVSLFLLAGVLGLPGLDLLDEITDLFFDFSPLTEIKRLALEAQARGTLDGTIATLLVRGLPSIFGADISTRVGLGEKFLPLELRDWKGAWWTTIENAARFGEENATLVDQIRNLSTGLGAPLKALEAQANGLPLVETLLTDPDRLYDALREDKRVLTSPWKRGRIEYRPTTPELLLKSVGGMPVRETRLRDLQDVARRDIGERRDTTKKALDRFVTALKQNDPAAAQAAIEEAAAEGVYLSGSQIRRALRDANKPRLERLLGRAPKQLRPEIRRLYQGVMRD